MNMWCLAIIVFLKGKKVRYLCIVLAALLMPQLAVAQMEGPPEDIDYHQAVRASSVSVTPSTQAREQFARLAPSDRKRAEEAAAAGAAFIKLYLDGLACMDTPNYDEGMPDYVDDPENMLQICSGNSVSHNDSDRGPYTVWRVVCPHTSLVSVELNHATVSLKYQTREVGAMTEYPVRRTDTFDAADSGKKLGVTVTVNTRNKVVTFSVDGGGDQEVYERLLLALPFASNATAEEIRRRADIACR